MTERERLKHVLFHLGKKRQAHENHTQASTARPPVFDSGASLHATGKASNYSKLTYLKSPQSLKTAGGTSHQILAFGDITYAAKTAQGKEHVVIFKQVAFCPDLGEHTFLDTTRLRDQDGWTCDGKRGVMK